MKFETQEINGLSGNAWSKHITEEHFHSTFMAEGKEGKKLSVCNVWYQIANSGQYPPCHGIPLDRFIHRAEVTPKFN